MDERSMAIHNPHGTRSVRLVAARPCVRMYNPAVAPRARKTLSRMTHFPQADVMKVFIVAMFMLSLRIHRQVIDARAGAQVLTQAVTRGCVEQHADFRTRIGQ